MSLSHIKSIMNWNENRYENEHMSNDIVLILSFKGACLSFVTVHGKVCKIFDVNITFHQSFATWCTKEKVSTKLFFCFITFYHQWRLGIALLIINVDFKRNFAEKYFRDIFMSFVNYSVENYEILCYSKRWENLFRWSIEVMMESHKSLFLCLFGAIYWISNMIYSKFLILPQN